MIHRFNFTRAVSSLELILYYLTQNYYREVNKTLV